MKLLILKYKLAALLLRIKLLKAKMLFTSRNSRGKLRLTLIALNVQLAKQAVPYYLYTAKKKVKNMAQILN
jgi:hypothetical protein